ncbi:MAG: RNA polymerase sigma factor [Sandaracinaceae bacterium]
MSAPGLDDDDPPRASASTPGRVAWPDVRATDAELVARCLEGDDRWARGALYRRHAETVAGLALRLLRDRDEADDVLQDTFVCAFQTLGALRDPAQLGAWLRTICVRQVHRRFRRRRLLASLGFRRTTIPLEELALRDAGQEAREELRRVDAVLARLPVRARIVWSMRVIEGETLPAIAEAMDVSLVTVKRDVRLAQDALDALFGDRSEEEPC